jgi:hypothetical protein
MRYLRRSLRDSWKITAGLAMKQCLTDASLCRDLFFGSNGRVVTDADVARYQQHFARDSAATIDLMHLAKCLPSNKAVDGKAAYVEQLPPCMVMGAVDDFIVDREGVEETARYFGVSATYVDSPHDVMLGAKWRNGADAIAAWLQQVEEEAKETE